jgi:hypothetical protein
VLVMAESGRVLSREQVVALVLAAFEAAADCENHGDALVAARNLLADLDRVSLLRVAGAMALLATRRQQRELTVDWLVRMRLEQAWSAS